MRVHYFFFIIPLQWDIDDAKVKCYPYHLLVSVLNQLLLIDGFSILCKMHTVVEQSKIHLLVISFLLQSLHLFLQARILYLVFTFL